MVNLVHLGLLYRKLTDRDFKVLQAVERLSSKYEYVPVELIEKTTRLPSTHVNAILFKLNKLKLVKRRLGDYVGYRLTYLGLDMLALRSLVQRDVIHAIGDRIGAGKESDVYSALTPTGERAIVKFHRVGRTSFRHVTLVRHYAAEKWWATWLHLAKLAGEREFRALEELYKVGALVPRPLGYSRHAVVTEYVWGALLQEYREAVDPEGMLRRILETVRKAYLEVGIVHGDLSEYNIIVVVEGEEEKPYIIDWPQYVEREHPSAQQLLRRDVEYVAKFFRRRFGVEVDVEEALKYVRGEREEPPV